MPSVSLESYLRLRGEGCSIATASDESGLPIDQAWITEDQVQRGELKFIKGENRMAQTAKPEDEEVIEIQKPDFERAIRVLKHDVKPAEENNAESRGDLSAAWKIIEDECHCNKAAAKAFNKLLTMSAEKRDDYLRTLYGLMSTAGLGISKDLVDQMTEDGEAPTMPIVDAPLEGLATLQQPELTH